jgi:hypothetical protein
MRVEAQCGGDIGMAEHEGDHVRRLACLKCECGSRMAQGVVRDEPNAASPTERVPGGI